MDSAGLGPEQRQRTQRSRRCGYVGKSGMERHRTLQRTIDDQGAALSLTSTALGGITTPISLIRRPVPGEASQQPRGIQPAVLFASHACGFCSTITRRQALLASGCAGSDMMALDGIDTVEKPCRFVHACEYREIRSRAAPRYSAVDGYWVSNGNATITGCIKIEYQDKTGTFHDDTATILALGIRGKNTNPLSPKCCVNAAPHFARSVQRCRRNPDVCGLHRAIRLCKSRCRRHHSHRTRARQSVHSNLRGRCGATAGF